MVLVQPTGTRYLRATADATFVRDELTCDPGLPTSQADLAGVIMQRGLFLLMAERAPSCGLSTHGYRSLQMRNGCSRSDGSPAQIRRHPQPSKTTAENNPCGRAHVHAIQEGGRVTGDRARPKTSTFAHRPALRLDECYRRCRSGQVRKAHSFL